MKVQLQESYFRKLKGYAGLVHGNVPIGLVPKLAMYSALLDQSARRGERLWKIEPLLIPILRAVEIDLHLATAKLLEPENRSDGNLFKFLKFCNTNSLHLPWKGTVATFGDEIQRQLDALETHRSTIAMVLGRRDKYFAHLDKRYFAEPEAIFTDFPLREAAVVSLINCVIDIVSSHERRSELPMSFHLGEFYEIGVDNMVRNLETGRKTNFPDQLS